MSEAQDVVDRMLADRGPIPHHRLQNIARVLRKALVQQRTQDPAKKPA